MQSEAFTARFVTHAFRCEYAHLAIAGRLPKLPGTVLPSTLTLALALALALTLTLTLTLALTLTLNPNPTAHAGGRSLEP